MPNCQPARRPRTRRTADPQSNCATTKHSANAGKSATPPWTPNTPSSTRSRTRGDNHQPTSGPANHSPLSRLVGPLFFRPAGHGWRRRTRCDRRTATCGGFQQPTWPGRGAFATFRCSRPTLRAGHSHRTRALMSPHLVDVIATLAAAELFATYTRGERGHAIAARIELRTDRWCLTALYIG
ncbi:Rv3235 family protein [Mycolicibacterium peregrinum]|uniref:Rv3235 family protein n=1 Tax=Mycolicibacterium peregrinum TaxID=43304 RepID=UPI003AAD40A6